MDNSFIFYIKNFQKFDYGALNLVVVFARPFLTLSTTLKCSQLHNGYYKPLARIVYDRGAKLELFFFPSLNNKAQTVKMPVPLFIHTMTLLVHSFNTICPTLILSCLFVWGGGFTIALLINFFPNDKYLPF